jgi:hypothetical protein
VTENSSSSQGKKKKDFMYWNPTKYLQQRKVPLPITVFIAEICIQELQP